MSHTGSDIIQEKLPESSVLALLIHIFIGWGFLRLSALSIKHLEYNGYMALLPAFLMMLPSIFIAADFVRLYPGKDMSFLFQRAFGKILGFLCTLSVWVWLLFITVFIIRESHLMVVTYFFKTTSSTLVIFLFCCVSLYLAFHGIRACGRMAGFVLIPPLIIIYGLLFLGFLNIDPLTVRPIMAGNLRQWLAGGWDLIFIVIPTGAIFFYLPFVEHPQPARIRRVVFRSLIVIAPLFFLSILGTIGAFGYRAIPKMAWPTIEFFHIIDFPFLLLEQAGLLFLLAWYGFLVVTIGQSFFHLGFLLKKLFPPIQLRWYILSVGASAFLLSSIPSNTIKVDTLVENYRGISNVYFLLLFSITWLIIRLKAKRKAAKIDE